MSFKSKSRPQSLDKSSMPRMTAKVLGTETEYDLAPLLAGERVSELWGDDLMGSVYVYLCGEGKPASFKVPALTISASTTLNSLAYNSTMTQSSLQTLPEDPYMPREDSNGSFEVQNGNPYSSYEATGQFLQNPLKSPGDGHLYFPSPQLDSNGKSDGGSEVDRLIAARNLFAFLMGLPLIATIRLPTVFDVMCSIAKQLKELGFYDERGGGDFGPEAGKAFQDITNEFELRDVRGDSEKMLKALILGEKMRFTPLYYEAFTHLVGNLTRLGKAKAKWYETISINTRHRIERESHNLDQWQSTVHKSLSDFEFPHLFNNSAQSNVTTESRVVRFAAWKQNFGTFRSFVLSYYKDLYGSWPPKATKKNGLTIGGLNRVVLKRLYDDFCALYDLHVDRESFTTRKLDVEEDAEEEDMTENQLQVVALRKIMSEHDRSAIPLSPPIPFDLPRLPAVTTIDAGFDSRSEKEQVETETRKLKFFETTLILAKAHNMDIGTVNSPFLEAYAAFEEKQARDKSVRELRDMRLGHWLFLYAVLQRLPLLVVDAADLLYTEGVEYFLCKPPYGPPPWWTECYGNKSLVSEQVANTPEAIYARSHCWVVGAKFLHDLELSMPPAPLELAVDTLQQSPYLASVAEDSVLPGEALYLSPQAESANYNDWHDDYQPSQAPPPVAQYPVRSDSMMTQSTIASNARQSSVLEHGQHYRSTSQQMRHVSRNSEILAFEQQMNDGMYFNNMPPLANPFPLGGMGIMGSPSRPGSGYYGSGGMASRPVSRPPSRPASRAAFLEDDYVKSLEGPPSFSTGSGSGGYRTSFQNASTPQLSTESGSVSDPAQSVLGGGSVAGGNRSVSQTRPMTATKMGPSTFDDIFENLGAGYEEKKSKKKGFLGVGDKKSRGRLSFFGSGDRTNGSSTG